MSAPRKRPAVALSSARASTVALTTFVWSGLPILFGFVSSDPITEEVMSGCSASCLTAAAFIFLGRIASCILPQFVIWRAVVFGAYPALEAYRVAGWTLGSFRLENEASGGA